MIMLKHLLCIAAALTALSCPAQNATNRPNILFAIADDWGLQAGVYGTTWVKTPAFDRVALDGLLFDHAYTPNAKCAPSRACIVTGRNPWQLKAAGNHVSYFPLEFKSWGEALAEKGWHVGYTMKGWAPGIATNAAGQNRELTGKAWNRAKTTPPTKGISNNDYATNFEDFLDANAASKPWCFWYGSVEPHRGYEFGSGVAKGKKKLTDIDRVPAYWPDNDTIRNDMLDYALEVEYFDSHLARMLATLEKRKLLENTVVIVTSDNGMPFPRVKGNVYPDANRLPFAVMWKAGINKPGRRITDFISFVDIAPTIVELAGLSWEQTGMAEAAGRSLVPIFKSTKSGRVEERRDRVLLGRERTDVGRPNDWGYPVRAVVTDEWFYARNFEPDRWPAGNPETGYLDADGGATKTFILQAHRENPGDPFWALCFGKRPVQELYNLKEDPDCVKNLAATPDAEPVIVATTHQLFATLSAQGDPRMRGQGHIFEAYPYANPGQVGFYERYIRGEKVRAGWVNPTDFEKPKTPSEAQREKPE